MKITSTRSGNLTMWRRWGDFTGIGMLIVIALLVYVATLSSGVVSRFLFYYDRTHHTGSSVYHTVKEYGFRVIRKDQTYFDSLIKVPERLLRDVEIPTLVLDIKFKHMQKLREKQAAALARGLLIQGDDDFVPAAIRYGNRTVEVKLRLKGDEIEHLTSEKWSLRIHTQGDGHVFGMRRFSLQHPMVRGYQSEALYFETLRSFNVLVPRYFFVNVVMNGENIGIMAFEEHFSKELLEHQGRREGVIVRFNESFMWAHYQTHGSFGPYYNFRNTTVDVFQLSKVKKSEQLNNSWRTAVGLLRGFMERKLPASQVFDTELTGRFLAVNDFWGSWHALSWNNMRFYFNPITLKLEPIGYDADLQDRKYKRISTEVPVAMAILEDSDVLEAYKRAIREISERLKDGSLEQRLGKLDRYHLNLLQKEFVFLESFDLDELYKREERVFGDIDKIATTNYETEFTTAAGEKVDPQDGPPSVHALLVEDNYGQFHIELASAVPNVVNIQSLQWVDTHGNQLPVVAEGPLSYPIPLPATRQPKIPAMSRIPILTPNDLTQYRLEIAFSIMDDVRVVHHHVIPYMQGLEQHPIPAKLNASHASLEMGDHDDSYIIRSGVWDILSPTILPAGANLLILGGTTLRFAPDAFLLVQGALDLNGTANAPIVLEGMSFEDGDGSWQGIVILNADSTSRWSNVTVRNTSGIEYPQWRLTGGVTFYYSDVDMDHCSFTGHRGEDALNIIHSHFNMSDTQITNTASDGFDSDFSTGVIVGGLFQDIGQEDGGDAFDMSGSEVIIEDTRFLRINDKALSVGERSKLTVHRITADDVGIGAASKDRSVLEINDSTIERARVAGLLAYVKKSEYGPAQLVAVRTDIIDGNIPAKVQTGSSLQLNGEQIETEDMDVDVLYDTVMKRGVR